MNGVYSVRQEIPTYRDWIAGLEGDWSMIGLRGVHSSKSTNVSLSNVCRTLSLSVYLCFCASPSEVVAVAMSGDGRLFMIKVGIPECVWVISRRI